MDQPNGPAVTPSIQSGGITWSPAQRLYGNQAADSIPLENAWRVTQLSKRVKNCFMTEVGIPKEDTGDR